MTETSLLNMDIDSQGEQCFRGEISLNEDELASLQPYIAPDFRFVPINDKIITHTSIKRLKTSSQSTKPETGNGQYQIKNLTNNENITSISFTEDERKKRTKKAPIKYNEIGVMGKNSEQENLIEKELQISPSQIRNFRPKKGSTTIKAKNDLQNNDVTSHHPPFSVNEKITNESILHTSKNSIPQPGWTNSCNKIMQEFKRKEGSSWFSVPVSPDIDGVPDYLTIITHPMDLKTIEEKLNRGVYRNPYEWQQDVRQIFYNAFKYHVVKNQVWHDAIKLAIEFEQIIIEISELCFNIEHPVNIVEIKQTQNLTPLKKPSNENQNLHKRELKKTSKNAKFISYQPCCNSKEDSTQVKPNIEIEKPLARSNHTPDILSNYEIPVNGFVPPSPPEQKIGINDKSLSNAQRKLLLSNLTKLAPNQRYAALELIQDDLGILAKTHASEIDFKFDPELLSIEKQKRINLYINQMIRANTEDFLKQQQKKIFDDHSSIFSKKEQKASNEILITNNLNIEKGQEGSASDDFGASSSSSSFSSSSSSTSDSNSEYEEVGKYSEVNIKYSTSSGSSDRTKKISLPEYTPVSESDQAFQIREDVMGRHADFLGHMDTTFNQRLSEYTKDSKYSAWADWKGQVIKQGLVSQREGAPLRNKDEIIAESYDARI